MMNNTLQFDSPVGSLFLQADDSHLTRLSFTPQNKDYPSQTSHPVLHKAREQLLAYFRHEIHSFDVPLKFSGTDFQNRVWQQLQQIDYGQTETYGQVAKAIHNPKAVRAVGSANNKNPIVIIVPCHRVIGASGQLVGYGGGLGVKEWLLKHEQSLNNQPNH